MSQYYDKEQVDKKLSQNLVRVEEVAEEVKVDVTKDVKAEVETFTASTTTKVNNLEGKVNQLDSKTTELNSNVAVYNQKVDNLNSAVSSETSSISIKPTDTSTYLATLPDAVYRAASAGTYQFTTLPDFDVVVNKVVPEGYSVKFSKDTSGWSVAVVEKLPMQQVDIVLDKHSINPIANKPVAEKMRILDDLTVIGDYKEIHNYIDYILRAGQISSTTGETNTSVNWISTEFINDINDSIEYTIEGYGNSTSTESILNPRIACFNESNGLIGWVYGGYGLEEFSFYPLEGTKKMKINVDVATNIGQNPSSSIYYNTFKVFTSELVRDYSLNTEKINGNINTPQIVNIEKSIFKDGYESLNQLDRVSSLYIASNGVIKSNSGSYSVASYKLNKDVRYVIKLEAIQSISGGYTIAGVKEESEIEGTVLPILLRPANSTETISLDYTPEEDTYLFVTMSSSALVTISKFKGTINKIEEIEQKIDNISVTTDYTGMRALQENPLSEIKTTTGLAAIFKDWGFIGDSLSSGYYESTTGAVTNYDLSWGQLMCKLTGAQGYNFSVGGQTTKGWVQETGTRGWGGASTNLKTAYTIYLGTNDINRFKQGVAGSYPAGNVATDVNLDDYTLNADTFAGWYGQIIQRIRTVQPKAPIFLITLPKRTEDDSYGYNVFNKVIRDLVDLFDHCYLIDPFTNGPIQDAYYRARYWNGGHYNLAGYQLFAYMVMTNIDWIVRNNIQAFRNQQFVGTDKAY